MELSLNSITKYTPLKVSSRHVEYLGGDNDIFELNLKDDVFVEKNYSFYYTCQMFTLKQKLDNLVSIHFERLSDKRVIISDFNSDVEAISILISDDYILVRLFPSGNINYAMEVKLLSNNEVFISKIPRNIPEYFLSICGICHIDLEKNIFFHEDNLEPINFQEIITISESGVLLKSESDSGHDLIWVSSTAELSIKEMKNAVFSAAIDTINNIIYISEQKSGLQHISLYDIKTLSMISSHYKCYGTVTPFYNEGRVFLYITGSKAGVYIQTIDGLIIKRIKKGLTHYEYYFYSTDKLKVTSILSPKNSTHHVLFFHGGPESSEWDVPRLPSFINELSKHNVNFHIINYLGSTCFGSTFRKMADGDVINKTTHPIIEWINSNSKIENLILFGGSFGGAIALELLCRKNEINPTIGGVLLINPLLDLSSHVKRVLSYHRDDIFFKNKFGNEDYRLIEKKRYVNKIDYNNSKILLILGRRDEVLGFDTAIEYLHILKKNNLTELVIDDGGHASLSHFIKRERYMIDFVIKYVI